MWWSILIWVVIKLIEWLMSARSLTDSEKKRVNHFIFLANKAENRACQLGCTRGGVEP